MKVKIDPSWEQELQAEFDAPYFKTLTDFVREEYRQGPCFPPGNEIFNAFNLCPFDKVKVVIIGQDPYHGEGQAEGLCFSVKEGVKLPPSLVNIFNEIEADTGRQQPTHGSLRRWAEQGVLLLNATLTVRAHQAASHQNHGWETFTSAPFRVFLTFFTSLPASSPGRKGQLSPTVPKGHQQMAAGPGPAAIDDYVLDVTAEPPRR